MKNRNGAWGLGLVIWGVIAACSPRVHELGDEPLAGAGGTGGSGSAPAGGSKSAGAAGAAPQPEECFSPTQGIDLAREEDALGCRCSAIDPVCVSDLDASPPWYGMLLCDEGRWKSVPPSCDEQCFSPAKAPNRALIDPDTGCACGEDDEQACVQTSHGGDVVRVSLYCEDGKWTSEPSFMPATAACDVEPASCHQGYTVHADGSEYWDGCNTCKCNDGIVSCTKRSCENATCRVDGVTYPHGARRVPTPFSRCNTCVCDNGALSECTGFRCADTECEEGTFPSRRCVECAPGDKCLEIETGCFGGPGCESGFCEEGRCG